MQKAFTMIELVFVIVIIGILAAVAIPKLAATRDDAKAAISTANLVTCIMDIGSSYTVSKTEDSTTAACRAVEDARCFRVDLNAIDDGNITVVVGTNSEGWCAQAHTISLYIQSYS